VRLSTEIRSAESNVIASRTKLENKKEGLAKLEGQLEMCVVASPASGMVVYASSFGNERFGEGNEVKVGKKLYRNELVMIIPDTEQMVAKVKVNEALSGLITKGQSAIVICDAFPDSVFNGEVLSVGVLASGGGWRDPNRRDYTVDIKINEPNNIGLKPSMRCEAEVMVGMVEEELYVPIHAVHRNRGTTWVWVQDGGGFAQRTVTVGPFSESFAVVLDGLVEGETVLLIEPPPGMVVSIIESENQQ